MLAPAPEPDLSTIAGLNSVVVPPASTCVIVAPAPLAVNDSDLPAATVAPVPSVMLPASVKLNWPPAPLLGPIRSTLPVLLTNTLPAPPVPAISVPVVAVFTGVVAAAPMLPVAPAAVPRMMLAPLMIPVPVVLNAPDPPGDTCTVPEALLTLEPFPIVMLPLLVVSSAMPPVPVAVDVIFPAAVVILPLACRASPTVPPTEEGLSVTAPVLLMIASPAELTVRNDALVNSGVGPEFSTAPPFVVRLTLLPVTSPAPEMPSVELVLLLVMLTVAPVPPTPLASETPPEAVERLTLAPDVTVMAPSVVSPSAALMLMVAAPPVMAPVSTVPVLPPCVTVSVLVPSDMVCWFAMLPLFCRVKL